jgi:predicted MPP superfamily phosphohydrolase
MLRRYPAAEVTTFPFAMGGHGPTLRIAFVSDLHSGRDHRGPFFDEIAAAIQAQAPDLLVLGGDFTWEELTALDAMVAALVPAIPRLGAHFVFGNHDHRDGPVKIRRALLDAGFQDLDNRGVRIEAGPRPVWLCGVDDLNRGFPDFEAATSGRQPGDATILVSHNPDVVRYLPPDSVDLVLSGHTHGGQVTFMGQALVTHSRVVGRQGSGLFKTRPGPLYVSRGVGTVFLPWRRGAPPEVLIVEVTGG